MPREICVFARRAIFLGQVHESWRRQRLGKNCGVVWAKVCRNWCFEKPPPSDFSEFSEVVHLPQNAVEQALQLERRKAIARWRRDMESQSQTATNWLKRTGSIHPSSVQVTSPDGSVRASTGVQDSFDCAANFWQQILHRDAIPEELQRLQSGQFSVR